MKDFWLSCGHHLLDRDAGGGLLVTDEFLKVYLARPELSAAAGRLRGRAHAACRRCSPSRGGRSRRPTSRRSPMPTRARTGNSMIAFRDHLLRHRTLEAAYLGLVRDGAAGTPPLFLNQLVHVILRNILDGCEDALVLRAAELFFRPQILTLHEGSLIAADEETIAGSSATPGLAAGVDAGLAGGERHRRAERRQCLRTGRAATSSTWRSI